LEASKRAVDNMRDTDDVGVLAFDDYFKWYHPMSDASDKQGIKDDIDSIPSGGGTVIMPALEEARAEIKHSDAQVKHIILLTDGMGETDNFSSVISKINADNVTLSTVAVGQYSDTALMADLAKQCGGRYYYADGNTDLPRIFSQEVFMGGNTYIKNGDYSLSVASSDITNGLFENGWFNILGYVAGSPKTGAQQLVVSDEGDPVLTAWQYGLGKTIAWNTSVDGGWTAAYSGNDDYAELWRRMIDYVTGTGGVGEDRVDVKQVGEQTVLEYYTDEYTDGTEITAIYTSPDGETGDVNFTASEPGVYRAVIDSTQKGLYNINVRRSDDGTIQGAFTTASVVQYSDEYRFDITDKTFRTFVENYGFYLTPEDNIWKKLEVSTAGSIDLTNFFIILAMILFLADIAGRRFGWEPARRGLKSAGRKQKLQPEVLPEGVPAGETAAPGMSGQPVNASFTAAPGQIPAQGQGAPLMNTGAPGAPQMSAGVKANKGKASKKKEEPASDTLDTSALLKKKRERNNG
nr:VWA domain-containing protein [Lachnospiraceae bacterium]